MSIEFTKSNGKVKRVYRKRKMTIIEEEEIITREIQEGPFESIFSKIDMQEIPISHGGIVSSYNQTEQDFDDFEERKELAEVIGLLEVPKKTVNAIDEIFGIFDRITKETQPDVVKMVKALRKRC